MDYCAARGRYRFNPWRAPGSAPVIDPCGQAGGKYKQTPVGGDSVFVTVNVSGKVYSMGDLGSQVLPASDPKDVPTYKAGSTPRVAWGMRYNHGGGYQYRLCPAEKMPCTEQDFQQIPLDFVRESQAIMWNNGTLYPIKGKFVDDTVCNVVPKVSSLAACYTICQSVVTPRFAIIVRLFTYRYVVAGGKQLEMVFCF